ncbi:hypothetical protein Q669_27890 [Labrenzia sp. C1B10]|nr:hypothetical protein Q669_27890 [Labrenzia sp. C1B10]ERS03539.1 hypothetical protein Q675_31195 [Labrenzia sp. C1B70]
MQPRNWKRWKNEFFWGQGRVQRDISSSAILLDPGVMLECRFSLRDRNTRRPRPENSGRTKLSAFDETAETKPERQACQDVC